MTYGTVNVDSVVNSDGVTSGGLYGFKNRIINGAMMIDQRNAGGPVTASTTSAAYPVDRFPAIASDFTGTFTLQQSTTAPSGFYNSIVATVGTTYSPSGSNQYNIRHNIEGLNVADLGWGAAGAATVTLSFWVRASVTGTYGGSLSNSAFDRSYPFTFAISAANTWEQKTITIAGDTSGTWLKTNGIGIRLCISLGAGSTLQGTANAWAAGAYTSATGTTNWISNAGATFYITGVQLEKGSTATSFDYRPYGTELALCQRYYQQPLLAQALPYITVGFNTTSSEAVGMYTLRVPMRVSPSLIWSGTFSDVKSGATGTSVITPGDGCTDSTLLLLYAFTGLTAGANNFIRGTASTSVPKFSAEL